MSPEASPDYRPGFLTNATGHNDRGSAITVQITRQDTCVLRGAGREPATRPTPRTEVRSLNYGEARTMKRITLAVVLLVSLAVPAWAGFDEGRDAFWRSDYKTAQHVASLSYATPVQGRKRDGT